MMAAAVLILALVATRTRNPAAQDLVLLHSLEPAPPGLVGCLGAFDVGFHVLHALAHFVQETAFLYLFLEFSQGLFHVVVFDENCEAAVFASFHRRLFISHCRVTV